MTIPPYGSVGSSRGSSSDPFADSLNRFLGMSPVSSPPAMQRVPIGRLLTDSAREVIAQACHRAQRDGSPDLDTEHLLWACTQVDPVRTLLAQAGADTERLGRTLAEALPGESGTPSAEPGLTPAAKRVLISAHGHSRAAGASYIGPEHILAAFLDDRDSAARKLLGSAGADPDRLAADTAGAASGETPAAAGGGSSATPTLDQYGRDLTEEARSGRLDVVVGRADEVEQTVEILSRRTKNNPVLIGERGVGKTAVAEGLAQRIAAGDVPQPLHGRRVVALDLTGLVAGAKYRGEFEERLREVIDEVRESAESAILFIDELHAVVGAGSGGEGSMDAGSILKPALSRGELHVIGATTLDEYRKHLEKDAALERRFQPVMIPEPSVEETVQILDGLRDSYEAHHQVRFTDEALRAAAGLSDRYISDRFLPDKAIDLMDTAGARVRLRSLGRSTEVVSREDTLAKLSREKEQAVAAEDFGRASELKRRVAEVEAELAGVEERREGVMSVTEEDVADVLSRRTGIPVAQLTESERDRLRTLEPQLRSLVVGQDEAVTAVSEAVRRNRAGMGDPGRPVGSFLFLGPAGVGKTELAKALAELLFGDANRLVRFDMSEFQEQHTVSRLVGAPPGYAGHEEAGRLTEQVRRRPYSVLLFDEIEKAHPDIFNALLQVLDDGTLTDSQGRTTDFRNSVTIMTSNIGAQRILAHQGTAGEIRDELTDDLHTRFAPEFLNRLDDIVIFHGLREQELRSVLDLMLARSERRLRTQGIGLEVTDAAKELLISRGHDPESGARPLRRIIQTELHNRIASLLLSEEVAEGDTVVADAWDGALICSVRRPPAASAAGQEE